MLCMGFTPLRPFTWAALLISSVISCSQAQQSRQKYWEETATETLWRGRYSNCDYGFYVSLGDGVVGHGRHSPAPNHGIYLSLPDMGDVHPVSHLPDRSIWIDAHYNVSDNRSLSGVAKYELALGDKARAASHVTSFKGTSLAGLRAIAYTVEYEGRNGRMVEQGVLALRSGVVYTIAVRSPTDTIAADREEFDRVRTGFKVLPIPKGQCSNDQ